MSLASPGAAALELVSVTTPLEDVPDLASRLSASGGVAWLRNGEGFVGSGAAARIPAGTGPGRFARAASAVADLFAGARIDDQVRGWGTGPIAFGTFTFDPDSPGSELIVPSVMIGVSDGQAWLTRTGFGQPPEVSPAGSFSIADRLPVRGCAAEAALDEETFLQAVGDARDAIARGGLEKVVLSLQKAVHADAPFDLRRIVANLAAGYPGCYTFAFESLVGASPELLVRRQGSSVRSTPLAGSSRRGATPEEDAALGAALLASTKDRFEHDLAVVTVVESLHRLCSRIRIDPEPSLLRLANVQHLATGIEADLAGRETALEIAGAVHPTAAVCGTPTRRALAVIRQLEGTGRGRYAGPVGWVDASGDGEWAIALRCAEVSGTVARLHAGCGIVAASDPAGELEEARLKLRPILSALELPPAAVALGTRSQRAQSSPNPPASGGGKQRRS